MKTFRINALIVSAALTGAALTGCATTSTEKPTVVTYHAAYPAFATGADLLKAADLVIRGTALTSRMAKLYPDAASGIDPLTNPQAGVQPEEVAQAREESAVVVTISTVRVDETIKGAAGVGDTIEVSQLGGSLDGVRYESADTTILSPGNGVGYLLFLAAHDRGKPYDLLNPEQAMYIVGADGSLTPAHGNGSRGIRDMWTLRSAAAR
jgi:hypothetical protein